MEIAANNIPAYSSFNVSINMKPWTEERTTISVAAGVATANFILSIININKPYSWGIYYSVQKKEMSRRNKKKGYH